MKKKRLTIIRAFLIAVVCLLCPLTVMASDTEATVDLENGVYSINVSMEGGTGKASITSPCKMTVENGKAYALIEWSSENYDYMIVDGEKYLPENEEGNSQFTIPITVFNEPMTVTADTTAMSVPHEIEYTLTFDSSSLKVDMVKTFTEDKSKLMLGIVIVLFLVAYAWRMKKNAAEQEKK